MAEGYALMNCFDTQGKRNYATGLLATMRNIFGGHAVARKTSRLTGR
jgi:6-phosphogluconate dehydrogenase (decarboxylating)